MSNLDYQHGYDEGFQNGWNAALLELEKRKLRMGILDGLLAEMRSQTTISVPLENSCSINGSSAAFTGREPITIEIIQ